MEVVLVSGEGEERFAGKLRSELNRLFKQKDPFVPLCGLCVITARQQVSAGNPVIVFCGKPTKIPAGGRLAILEETNTEAAALLAQMGIEAISCGMNEKNTLTVSSLDLDRAVVCLQRSITALNGQTVEPAEFPFEVGKESKFPFLAATALYILAAGTS